MQTMLKGKHFSLKLCNRMLKFSSSVVILSFFTKFFRYKFYFLKLAVVWVQITLPIDQREKSVESIHKKPFTYRKTLDFYYNDHSLSLDNHFIKSLINRVCGQTSQAE